MISRRVLGVVPAVPAAAALCLAACTSAHRSSAAASTAAGGASAHTAIGSAAATSATAGASTAGLSSSASPTPSAPTSSSLALPAPSATPVSSAAATAHFLQVAKATFPGKSTKQLVGVARGICRDLVKDPSVHDEVGTVLGQTGSQGTADQVVRAAIPAYCPRVHAG